MSSKTASRRRVTSPSRSPARSVRRSSSSSLRPSTSAPGKNLKRLLTPRRPNLHSSISSAGSPKRKKPKKKSLKQRLRDATLDEGDDLRQRLRQMEDKNRRLEDKLSVKKRTILSMKKSHQQEVGELNAHKKRLAEAQQESRNEKAKLEKKVRNLTKQVERVEMSLMKEKSSKSSESNDTALLQDIFTNLKEFMETQLQCAICNEVYVFPSVITCGHTFCEECIHGWRQKKQATCSCPICRADIIVVSPNQTLQCFIEKFVDNYFPDDAKKARDEIIKERTKLKSARGTPDVAAVGEGLGILTPALRHRILYLNDSDSDDDESWGNMRFPSRSPPDSPGRFSESSLASTRSVHSEGMISTPNGSEIGSDQFLSNSESSENEDDASAPEHSLRTEDDEEDSFAFSHEDEVSGDESEQNSEESGEEENASNDEEDDADEDDDNDDDDDDDDDEDGGDFSDDDSD